MKSFTRPILLFSLALLWLASVPAMAQAKSTTFGPTGDPGSSGQRSRTIIGEVERVGAQLQLVLTNQSDKQTFQGTASVGIVSSTSPAIQIAVTLSPGETRRI